jgi:hypothetical protein
LYQNKPSSTTLNPKKISQNSEKTLDKWFFFRIFVVEENGGKWRIGFFTFLTLFNRQKTIKNNEEKLIVPGTL